MKNLRPTSYLNQWQKMKRIIRIKRLFNPLELVQLKHNRLEPNQHRHNLLVAQKLSLPRFQLKPNLPMMDRSQMLNRQLPNSHLSRTVRAQLKTKTVMTLATTMQITTEAMTLMLEPVRVVLVATRSRSQPLNESKH